MEDYYPIRSNSDLRTISEQEKHASDCKPMIAATDEALRDLSAHQSRTYERPSLPLQIKNCFSDSSITITANMADFNAKPQLKNVISTVDLACQLDLKKIVLYADNADYNPKRSAGILMRISQPVTTAHIYSTGRLVCVGARTEELSRLAARKYVHSIRKLGFPVKFLDFKIINLVATCDVKFSIRLSILAINHYSHSCYEPEVYPGLIYRMEQPRIKILVFPSGKVVFTDTTVWKEIIEAFDNILPILEKYKMKS